MSDIKDILTRIEETNHIDDGWLDLKCRLTDCAEEITKLRAIIQDTQQVDDVLAPQNDKALFNVFKVKAQMYEYVRRLNAQQFAEIYAINIKTGVHFDHLIIQAMNEPKSAQS